MSDARNGSRAQVFASGFDRRQLLQRAGTASAAFIGMRALGSAPASAATQATPDTSPAAGPTPQFAFAGSYTRGAPGGGGALEPVGIAIFAVDPVTGALTPSGAAPSDNPSWLALHPTRPFLYAVNETEDYEGEPSGSVEAFAIDPETGALTLLNEQSSQGRHPAHLAIDPSGAFAVVANYSGPFVVLPIAEDGTLAPASDIVQNEGTGPNEARQEMSHPHAVVFDPAGRYLATADLGIDTVRIYRVTPEGQLAPVSEATVAPGAGPRHLAFSPDGRFLYVANELNATVTGFAYDPATGTLGEEIQTISMVPEDFPDPKSAAEIAVHPSGRFLYASNRGLEGATSPEADSIVGYIIDQQTGQLTLIGHTSEGLDFPRGFALDPTGTWLYAANQQGDSIVQFAIDPETGALSPTGQVTATPTPVSIVFTGA